MEIEGVIFRPGLHVGVDVTVERLMDDYDVLVLAGGAERPRELEVPGRELEGVHFAMDFLAQQNRRNAGDDETKAAPGGAISAMGKHVDVTVGGDTGPQLHGHSHHPGATWCTTAGIQARPTGHGHKEGSLAEK